MLLERMKAEITDAEVEVFSPEVGLFVAIVTRGTAHWIECGDTPEAALGKVMTSMGWDLED